MGFKDKLGKYYSEAYMQKYGDRISSASGTVVSIKCRILLILSF